MSKRDNDLVSVIIPVYNAEKFIERCINSVLKQDYSNYEIILVNDGSSDKSNVILQQFAKRHTHIKLIEQKNQGVSAARNIGIKNSSGDWIVFIDSDDYIDYRFLSILVFYAKNYSADIVASEYYTCIDKTFKHSKFLNVNKVSCYSTTKEHINLVKSCIESRTYGNTNGPTNLGVPWAKLYKRRTIIDEAFDTKLTHMEDTIFNINAIMNSKKIVYIPEPLYYYVIHANSTVRSVHNNFEFTAQTVVDRMNDFVSKYHLEEELKEAVDYKKFCLYYQCIYVQYIRGSNACPSDIMQLNAKLLFAG